MTDMVVGPLTYEIRGTFQNCAECQAPVVMPGPPVGPMTIKTDADGNAYITPHYSNCQRAAEPE